MIDAAAARLTAALSAPAPLVSRSFVDSVLLHAHQALPPLLLGLLLTAILVPVSSLVARRVGALAPPGGHHIHSKMIPSLGGLALYAGFLGAVLVFADRDRTTLGLLITSGLAAVIFAGDDVRPFAARWKLAAQVGLALLAIWAFGFQIGFLTLPHFGLQQLGLLALPISLFWLVGVQNTVNLLDGIDGLAAGVVGIVAIALMLAAANKGQTQVLMEAAALTGCCAGFLVFNFHPARIFMGDGGSHFLGIAVGLIAIAGVAKVTVVLALAVPVLALSLPILDTGWAVIRRRRGGLGIAQADTKHIHHQMLGFGLSQRETCLLFYLSTAIFSGIGLMLFGHRHIIAVVIILFVVALSTVVGEKLKASCVTIGWPHRWPLSSSGRSR